MAEQSLDSANIAKLRWRCRRGMRELDVLFSNWLESSFEYSSAEQQAAFIALLEREDDQLWSWLAGRDEPDQPDLREIVSLLQGQTP
ncbi:MAG: succinate dehydrogenase assembly factor 2 [Pseudomonadota bacterium]